MNVFAFRGDEGSPLRPGPPSPVDAAELELVRRARAGDRRAFERLWRRHAAKAHAVALAILPSSLAADLLQDVAVAALGAIQCLRKNDGFAAWLCAIARNRARNLRAAAKRAAILGDMDAMPARQSDVDEIEADEILAAIRALPEAYRESLTMRLVAGLSGPEIADRLGMTSGSVRVNLCRGIKLLREALESGYGRPRA